MAEEVIKVAVEDTSIDVALAKLGFAEERIKSVKAGLDDLDRRLGVVKAKRVTQAALLEKVKVKLDKEVVKLNLLQKITRGIPTLTRAERLLITQVPGARAALALSFRGKMLAGAPPVLAAALVMVYVVRMIKQLQKDIERQQIGYENMLSEGLDLTHREIGILSDIQAGYATWWDQFEAYVDSEGFISAIGMMMRDLLPSMLFELGYPLPPAAPPLDMGTASYEQFKAYYDEYEERMIRGEAIIGK